MPRALPSGRTYDWLSRNEQRRGPAPATALASRLAAGAGTCAGLSRCAVSAFRRYAVRRIETGRVDGRGSLGIEALPRVVGGQRCQSPGALCVELGQAITWEPGLDVIRLSR